MFCVRFEEVPAWCEFVLLFMNSKIICRCRLVSNRLDGFSNQALFWGGGLLPLPDPPRIYIGGRRGPAPLRMLRDHLDKVL
jgi:hypothetical protein